MSNITLEDMRVFTKVVELKSFTATAKQLGTAKSTISRHIQMLENALEARLMERNSRNIQLTEVGQEFYLRCLHILDDVEETVQTINHDKGRVQGVLRIYAPSEFSRQLFPQLIPKFYRIYPDIELEIHSGSEGKNLIEEGYHVLFHLGEPDDSSFIARQVVVAPANYYVSQAYIDEHGEPQTPQELINHDCVIELINQTDNVTIWRFPDKDKTLELNIKGKFLADSTPLTRSMVEEGMGISMLPEFVCRTAVQEGRLKKLFGGRYQVMYNVYALYPSRRHPPAKVKAFLDFMAKELQPVFDALTE